MAVAHRVEQGFLDDGLASFKDKSLHVPFCPTRVPGCFLSQRIAESWLRGGCLRLCVDRASRNRRVFCPTGNKSPTHSRNLTDWFLRMLPDHRDWLRGSDVVPGTPVVLPIGSVEMLLDYLLSPRQSVATAHGEKLRQIKLILMLGLAPALTE